MQTAGGLKFSIPMILYLLRTYTGSLDLASGPLSKTFSLYVSLDPRACEVLQAACSSSASLCICRLRAASCSFRPSLRLCRCCKKFCPSPPRRYTNLFLLTLFLSLSLSLSLSTYSAFPRRFPSHLSCPSSHLLAQMPDLSLSLSIFLSGIFLDLTSRRVSVSQTIFHLSNL